jgi:glycosyltransferase involved in cell wall biosynthesis
MKIDSVLLVTPQWTRDGGVATHVIASAELLAQQGIRVNVLAARVEQADLTPGVTVFHSPELFTTGAPAEVRVGDALSSAPTVIHAHQFDDPDLLKFMRERSPVVLSAHGYTMCTSGVHYFRPGEECTRPHGPGCVPNLALRGCAHTRELRWLPSSYKRASLALQAMRSADLAISYSTVIDRHLSVNGVARRRVIPLFTTMKPAAASGHATRRRVVFAGRVVTPKGVGVLIRAAREVDGEFVICGDGWRLQQMRRLAQRLGVEQRVRFTGWLDADDLARELAEASVVALPSVWPEPFGLVGIEAFAAGRPVVASQTGGIEDWLQHGVNGLAVEPGDAGSLARALNELLADPARQDAMGAAGKRLAQERFSRARHLGALLDAYEDARTAWEARTPQQPPRAVPLAPA